MTLDIAHLRSWIDRTEVLEDTVTVAPLRALTATLDRDDAPQRAGDAVPPCWHWLYFLPIHRQSELGPDGHPRRGGFLPPVPLPRRMWAGSRIGFVAPLRVATSPTRSARWNASRPPAHIRRGSSTGGRKPPRRGWPSAPSSLCLASGRK